MNSFIILCICSLLAVNVHCKPAYKLTITRVAVTKSIERYADFRWWLTKPDRHTNALNCEFNIYEVPADTKVKIKAYEFLTNKYRPFAINLDRNLCQFIELEYKMMFYKDFVKVGAHMPEPRCPITPGNYSFANLVPDIGNYPGNMPLHNFMFDFSFWSGSLEMIAVQLYGTLDRDAVIREQYG